MSTLTENVLGYAAVGSVKAGVAPTFYAQRGFSPTILRNGAGDYTLTMGQGETLTECVVQCTLADVTPVGCSVEVVSTTQMRVRVNGADTDFWIEVKSIGPA